MNSGNIVQIIGAVVDVDFSGAQMPALYNALTVDWNSTCPAVGLAPWP